MGNQTNRLLPRLSISGELHNLLLSGNSEYTELMQKTFAKEEFDAGLSKPYKLDLHNKIKRSLENIEADTASIMSKLKGTNSLRNEYKSLKSIDSSLPPNLLQEMTKTTIPTNIAVLEFSYEAMETHDEYTGLSKDLQNLNNEIETAKTSTEEGDATLNAFKRHLSKLANRNEYNVNYMKT